MADGFGDAGGAFGSSSTSSGGAFSTSGGAFGSSSTGLSAPSGQKVKGKKEASFTGALDNIVDSTRNVLGSVIPGIEQTAVAAAESMFPGGVDSFNPFNKESYKTSNFGSDSWKNPFSAKTYVDEFNTLKASPLSTKIVKPAIESYKQRYSGGFGNILHNIYEDPVPFVLDAATVIGGGINAVAKVGSGLEAAGKISSTSKLAQMSKPGEIQLFVKEGVPVTKFTSERPTTKMAQLAWNKALMQLPPDMRVVGEYARAGKILAKSTNIDALRHQLSATDYLDSFSKLSKNERMALAVLQEAPTELILQGWKKVIAEGADGPSILKHLDDPKIMALWSNPTEGMLRTHKLAGDLADTNVALLRSKGQAMRGADVRPYLTSLIAMGAKFVKETPGKLGLDTPALKSARDEVAADQKRVDRAEARVAKLQFTSEELKRIGSVAIDPDIEIRLQAELDALNKMINDARPKLGVVSDEVKALREQRVLHKRLLKFAVGLEKLAAEYGDEAKNLGIGKASPVVPAKLDLPPGISGSLEWAKRLRENVALLDKEGADQSRYHGLLSTSGKASLKKGETWRDRVLKHASLTEDRANEWISKNSPKVDNAPSVGTADSPLVTVLGPAEIQAKIEELTFMIHALGGKIPMVRFPELEAAASSLRSQLKKVRDNPLSVQSGNRIITASGDIIDPIGSANLNRVTAALSVSKERLASLEAAAANRIAPTGIVGPNGEDIGPMLAQVKQHIAESGRPVPVYRPHQSVVEKSGRGSGGSGGRGIPVAPGGTRQNTGVLAQMGRLALDPDLLGPAFMRSVKFALYSDRHDVLLAHAVPRDYLPDGFVLVRQKRGEKISYTDRTQDQFAKELADSLPDNKPPQDMNLTTTRLDEAVTDAEGRYLVVPKSFADNVVGEFGRSYMVPNKIFTKSMVVWRALVLGLRPAWLVNNIVGNHLMAAIRFAGINGMRAYLNAIYNTKGAAAVRQMLGMKDMPRGLSKEFMREFFPEQISGTFTESQMPKVSANLKLGKYSKRVDVGKTLSLGLAPVDRASEGMLRRASVETALRRSPEVRAQAGKMLGETRTFEDMARDAILTNKGVAERASAEVNAALGDFLSMGQFEKNLVRQVIPFYGWFKAITKVTLRMPIDTPIRANILANLSAISAENTEAQFGSPLPQYLKPSISLGKNRLLKMGGMSPYASVGQLASAARSAFPGAKTQNIRDLVGLANPFLAQAQTALDPYNPAKFGSLAQIPFDVLRNTPQARILFPVDSKLYEGDPRLRSILAYAGLPIVDVNRGKAAKDAADGK